MIFKAYLDEANTGEKEPTITVAGFLGTAPQWRLAERRLRALKRREGFTVFHAVEFKARSGEFKGWSDAKCMRLIESLARLIREEPTEAIEISLPYQQYMSQYRDTPFPKGVPTYSQYGVCIYTVLDQFVQIVRRHRGRHYLQLIVEDGHRNAGAVNVVFDDMRKYLEHLQETRVVLATASLAKKSECELLMMVDFQAHASGIGARRTWRPTYASVVAQRPIRPDEAAITSISHRPWSLQGIKDRFVDARESRMEAYRRQKALRPDSQKVPQAREENER